MAFKFLDIKIAGFEDLNKNLKKLNEKVQTRITKAALKKGANVILAAAKQNTPSDSGANHMNLKVKAIRKKRSSTNIGFAIQTGTREELGIKGKGYYPFSLEYGTKDTEAQPYLRPALEDNREKAIQVIGKALEKSIARQVKKNAKRKGR